MGGTPPGDHVVRQNALTGSVPSRRDETWTLPHSCAYDHAVLGVAGRRYRLGHDYRDRGSINDPEDEFLRWINVEGSGIRNMGGIRPLRFTSLDVGVHAWIVLVTDERSTGSSANPWEDLVDIPHGRIVYWGDAKFDAAKTVGDFVGNRSLEAAWGTVLDNRRHLSPPILHFSKRATGVLRFNGLCVLDRLELTWFEDHGRPVRNYRAHLSILDEEFAALDWLHERVNADSEAQLRGGGPPAWRRYLNGYVDRLSVWAPSLRSTQSQLPPTGSRDDRILSQLVAMHPTTFEAATVALFRELDEIRHQISRTRPTADGGFDFSGTFTLPPPLLYEIEFLGEAKKYARTTAVGPQHVSRLVARLGRGQYGVFVTTSYFTRQAQEEVLADRYPARLVCGSDLVRMIRELRIARGDELSLSWLRAVREELERPIEGFKRAAEERAPYRPGG